MAFREPVKAGVGFRQAISAAHAGHVADSGGRQIGLYRRAEATTRLEVQWKRCTLAIDGEAQQRDGDRSHRRSDVGQGLERRNPRPFWGHRPD